MDSVVPRVYQPVVQGSTDSSPSLRMLSAAVLFQKSADGTHHPDFYNALAKESQGSTEQNFVIQIITKMSLEEKAALPLFEEACDEYLYLIIKSKCEALSVGFKEQATLSYLGCTPLSLERGRYLMDLVKFMQHDYVPLTNNLFGAMAQNPVVTEDYTSKKHILNSIIELNNKQAFTHLDLSCCYCDLSGLNLSGLNLGGGGTYFGKINLSNTNLANTNLSFASFHRANLSGANLTNAILDKVMISKGADFSHAILVNASMRWVCANQINFTNANFTNADLCDTSLVNSDTTNAIFDGAKNITDQIKIT